MSRALPARSLGPVEGTSSATVVRLRAAWREAVLRAPGLGRRQILVNEFPKSGGTWLCRMLRDVTGRQFADNNIPMAIDGIIKQHSIRSYPADRRILVWRDPRDVMVSLYYHCFFVHQDYPFNAVAVERARNRYQFEDYDAVAENLECFAMDQFVRPLTPPFTINDFGETWVGETDAVHVRYEDLRANTSTVLEGIVAELDLPVVTDPTSVAKAHSLAAHGSSSTAPQQRTFVRRGKVGGFADEMSSDLALRIYDACGPWVTALGYKRNFES